MGFSIALYCTDMNRNIPDIIWILLGMRDVRVYNMDWNVGSMWINVWRHMKSYVIGGILLKLISQARKTCTDESDPHKSWEIIIGRKMSKRIPLGFVGGMFVTVSIFGWASDVKRCHPSEPLLKIGSFFFVVWICFFFSHRGPEIVGRQVRMPSNVANPRSNH